MHIELNNDITIQMKVGDGRVKIIKKLMKILSILDILFSYNVHMEISPWVG